MTSPAYTPSMFTDTHDDDHDTLTLRYGGKGANLHRMATELKLPVPEGFTIPTAWTFKRADNGDIHDLLIGLINKQIGVLNEATGLTFGAATDPLIVSVRSGAPRSMPGMMETILNLGLNDDTVVGLAEMTNPQFAQDAHRRFIQMYATTVLGVDPHPFNEHLEACKSFAGTEQLDEDVLVLVVKQFKDIVKKAGHAVPEDVNEQLIGAVDAVFKSWDAPKAKSYRKIEQIPHNIGTAVNVQRMVFGNMNDQSGTGVAFTRDPNTGEPVVYGDFLVNAQGEDVVDGSHVTTPIAAMGTVFPEQYEDLTNILARLEETYQDMCDVEFTVENNKLFILQTRVGKRNPDAAIRMAFDMYDDNLITREQAVERIQALKLAPTPSGSATFNGTLVGSGEPASPGKVVGEVVFSSDDAVAAKNEGKDVILVTHETDPSDIEGMAASVGILTAKGGLVSHAAVVARGWGKACIVGFSGLTDISGGSAIIGGKTVKHGELICIDGATGEIYVGV